MLIQKKLGINSSKYALVNRDYFKNTNYFTLWKITRYENKI